MIRRAIRWFNEHREGAGTAALVGLLIVLVLFNLTILGLSVWWFVASIIALTVAFNGWALVGAIISGLLILSYITPPRR